MKVKVKRFSSYARIPQRAASGSACFDLYSARFIILEPNQTKKIETDVGFKFSSKFAWRIYLRSSLSVRGVVLGGSVID